MKTAAMKITVKTDAYERTWGYKPRGRGFWVFDVTGPSGIKRTVRITDSLGRAIQDTKALAREIGADTIEILP